VAYYNKESNRTELSAPIQKDEFCKMAAMSLVVIHLKYEV